MAGLHVKKGDRVKVIAGKDKGAIGEIIAVFVDQERVIVEGVNLVKRHRKESQGADGRRIEGGIITAEAPIHVSNVQLITKVDGADVVTRVSYDRVEFMKKRSDGTEYKAFRSQRVARKTGKEI